MKKIVSIISALILTLTAMLSLCACAKTDETYSRMTCEINPSVEFMLDSKGKVASVTALNDDGEVLLVGEVFVGLTADEAAEKFLQVSLDCGYINASASASESQLKISVSGGEKAEQLYSDVKAKAEAFISTHDVNAVVAKVDAMSRAALETLAQHCDQSLTDEQVKAMTDEELYAVVAAARKETAAMLSQKLKDAYYEAKAYQFDFAEREETKAIISGMGDTYSTILSTYDALLSNYSSAIEAVQKAYYDNLVDPECAYQQALAAVYAKKATLVEDKNKLDELSDGLEKTIAQGVYDVALKAYEAACTALTAADNAIAKVYQAAMTTMESVKAQLLAAREDFPEEITTKLTEKAADIQAKANTAKDSFFADFESQHSEDVAAIKAQLQAIKDSMKSSQSAE